MNPNIPSGVLDQREYQSLHTFFSNMYKCCPAPITYIIVWCSTPDNTRRIINCFPFSSRSSKSVCGIGSILVLMISLIFSEIRLESARPTNVSSSATPKNKMPPLPFAKALTLFSQLLGFFSSNMSFLSYSFDSPI